MNSPLMDHCAATRDLIVSGWQVRLQRESLSIMRDMKESLATATKEMNEKAAAEQHKKKNKMKKTTRG